MAVAFIASSPPLGCHLALSCGLSCGSHLACHLPAATRPSHFFQAPSGRNISSSFLDEWCSFARGRAFECALPAINQFQGGKAGCTVTTNECKDPERQSGSGFLRGSSPDKPSGLFTLSGAGRVKRPDAHSTFPVAPQCISATCISTVGAHRRTRQVETSRAAEL